MLKDEVAIELDEVEAEFANLHLDVDDETDDEDGRPA